MRNNMNEDTRLVIGFTGDVSFSGYFRGLEKQDILATDVKSFFSDNDATVINLESPITTSNEVTKIRLAHRSDPEMVEFFHKNFALPIISLANNHMMDYEIPGLKDTLKCIEESGIRKLGAGNNLKEAFKPVIIEEKGIRVGIIAIQYKKTLTATDNTCGPTHDSHVKIIKKTIVDLKKNVDYVVVVYHGGDEFLHTPMPYLRTLLQKYIDMGADVVVGHHPHTVEGYEKYNGKMIFYSLGNFVFDTDYQRNQKDTEDGMLLKLAFDKYGYEFQSLPIRINRDSQIIESREEDAYFKDIAEIDYERFWHAEAYRKVGILKSCNALEAKELAEMQKAGLIEKTEKTAMQKLADQIRSVIIDPQGAVNRLHKRRIMKKGRKAYKKEQQNK